MNTRALLSLLVICLLICNIHISACPSDSTSAPVYAADNYTFAPRKLITPLALTAAGAIGVGAFGGFKKSLNNDFSRWRGDNYWHGDDYLQYAPAAAYLALGACGVKGRCNFRDRVLVGATSYICMAAAVNLIKVFVNEKRPDSEARNSFPSGHSATVFLGAELMRIEYGNAIGAAGYAVAAGVGFLRMYNGRHWYNDVLAGAGIGILCARAAYWLLPLEKRLLGIREKQTSAVLVPYYSSPERAVGVSVAMNF